MAVRIRLAPPDDGEAVAAIYRPVVADTTISFEMTPSDREEMARRIDETTQSYPWLVCDVNGRTAARYRGDVTQARMERDAGARRIDDSHRVSPVMAGRFRAAIVCEDGMRFT